MKSRMLLCAFALVISTSVFAGPKENFDAAVKAAGCEVKATPGRSGTVMQYTLKCGTGASEVDFSGCILKCVDASASIGG